MESGLIALAWPAAALLLVVVAGLAFAFFRLRTRLAQMALGHAGIERIIEQANDGILVLDFVSGKLHHANPRIARMLGYSLEEIRDRTVFDLHFPEDLHRSAERIADVWAGGGLVYDDLPFRTIKGERLPVECSGKVTEYQGKPAVVIYARDISERLRLEGEVKEKNRLVEQQNKDMLSGLRYAQGIQMGMLPSLGELRASFADAFVINRPRDVVSGDFYWSTRVGDQVVVAVADCTGHGVPGALLSMTGIALLQQVVGSGAKSPERILFEMRAELLRTLAHQEGEGQVRDGMTLGLLVFDPRTGIGEFAGALCPLHILRKGADRLELVKGDRIPVGYHDGLAQPFEKFSLQLQPGDRLYMASDGFADQFGGPEGKKFKSSKLREVLESTGDMPIGKQCEALNTEFTAWRGELEQVDDVLLLGLQI
ncbi:MAG: SpoIIE family protein phosphatase [Flavobacteriales bacterium]|jgi:PAS domain S-box-containing protein|nr:SpoIIE family protein phosphatase [Flavobacteriales bacterium]